jgi:hypothetical protein
MQARVHPREGQKIEEQFLCAGVRISDFFFRMKAAAVKVEDARHAGD